MWYDKSMELKIERLGINGEGIAIINDESRENKVCFVDGALPGEVVDGEISIEKTNYCFADLNEIKVASKDRVEPKCPYFGICGGCDIQHMSVELQKELKKNTIKDTLRKLGGIEDVLINDVVRVNNYEYRNKMVFPYVMTQDGNSVLGMFVKNSHDIVDIDGCMIASVGINRFFKYSKEYLAKSNFKGYGFADNSGDIKYLVARENGGKLLVTIVATHMLSGLENYYNYLSKYFISVGLSIVVNDKKSNEIMSGKYTHLYGEKLLMLEENGIMYGVDNRGFLQVNNEMKNYLYNYVLEHIDNDENVIDAYSGAGLMSANFAKKCKYVYGIEINASASNSANELARRNGIENIKCICGDVDEYLERCIGKLDTATVVLDPARAGCKESVLNVLNKYSGKIAKNSLNNEVCRVSKIIYISCNIVTLSRDLKILKEKYNILSVTPMDMFPQTCHIETVVVLEAK